VIALPPRPDQPGEPLDPDRIDRILGRLGPVWRQLPNWPLSWLIVNLLPPGTKVSDAEIEKELDRLLGRRPGSFNCWCL
jgi:hypothetical protein